MAKRIKTKENNIKIWKKGINNIKLANSDEYAKNMRKGIRF